MRFIWAFATIVAMGAAQAQSPTSVLTLQRAIAIAEESNPSLRSAKAALAAAEGENREASSLLNFNPELTVEQGQRRADPDGTRFRESSIGISQTLEIAGQPGHRRSAARHGLAAAQADIDNVRVQLRADVELAFAKVLLLQRRIASESESLNLASEAARAVGKRVDAGEDSRLDGNLARVEADRAQSQQASTEEQLVEARARLAELLHLAPGALPQAEGDLPEQAPGLRLEALLAAAAARPELKSLLEREASANSRLQLERAAATPDITVGLSSAREGPPEARERALMFSVTVPLPFFKRNQANIGRALTQRDQAVIDREVGLRGGEALVRELWLRLQKLEGRVANLRSSTLARLDENLSLSRKAYQAGEIGIVQLVLVNRQAVDARRDYLEALGEYTQIRIALEKAAGLHSAGLASNAISRTNP